MKRIAMMITFTLLACHDAKPQVDGAAAASASVASAAVVVSAAPMIAPSVAPSVVTATPSAIASVSAAAPSDTTPPTWLKLGAGESIKERIATGSTSGCYMVKRKTGEEIACPPAAAPGATVDDIDTGNGHTCPPGFGASGSHYCSRTCQKNSDCHNKNHCDPDAHQCMH